MLSHNAISEAPLSTSDEAAIVVEPRKPGTERLKFRSGPTLRRQAANPVTPREAPPFRPAVSTRALGSRPGPPAITRTAPSLAARAANRLTGTVAQVASRRDAP